MFKCEFCLKEVASASALNTHQTTTQYCIKIQAKQLPTKNEEIEKLKYRLSFTALELAATIDQKEILEKDLLFKNDMIRDLQTVVLFNKIIYEDELNSAYKSVRWKILEYNNEMVDDIIHCMETGNDIIMDNIDLSSSRLDILKDNYTLYYYERGSVGVVDWLVDHVLKRNGKLAYRCIDRDSKMFAFIDKGDIVYDTNAEKLKSIILPFITIKCQEFRTIKFQEASKLKDYSELLKYCDKLHEENMDMGTSFINRLIERTYRAVKTPRILMNK